MSNTVGTYLCRDCLYIDKFSLLREWGEGSESSELRKPILRHCLHFFVSVSFDLEGIACLFYRREQIVNLYFSTVPLKAENLSVDIRR